MQNENAAETVHAIIQNRIDYLKNLIETKDGDPMELAIAHLGFIGTKASSETLMGLIEKESNKRKRGELAALLIGFSSFRDDYKKRLMACCDADEIIDTYAEVEELTKLYPRFTVCQEIIAALDANPATETPVP